MLTKFDQKLPATVLSRFQPLAFVTSPSMLNEKMRVKMLAVTLVAEAIFQP